MGTEMNAESAAGLRNAGGNGFGIGSIDIEPLERGAGAFLGLFAGSDDGLFQSCPKIVGERRHGNLDALVSKNHGAILQTLLHFLPDLVCPGVKLSEVLDGRMGQLVANCLGFE